jgi:hypothetical protein
MAQKYQLRELTPREMQCAIGACPAIYEVERVTPKNMECGIGICPEVYQNADSYFIIGEKVEAEEAGLVGKVGKDEVLIKVPRKLIDERQR